MTDYYGLTANVGSSAVQQLLPGSIHALTNPLDFRDQSSAPGRSALPLTESGYMLRVIKVPSILAAMDRDWRLAALKGAVITASGYYSANGEWKEELKEDGSEYDTHINAATFSVSTTAADDFWTTLEAGAEASVAFHRDHSVERRSDNPILANPTWDEWIDEMRHDLDIEHLRQVIKARNLAELYKIDVLAKNHRYCCQAYNPSDIGQRASYRRYIVPDPDPATPDVEPPAQLSDDVINVPVGAIVPIDPEHIKGHGSLWTITGTGSAKFWNFDENMQLSFRVTGSTSIIRSTGTSHGLRIPSSGSIEVRISLDTPADD